MKRNALYVLGTAPQEVQNALVPGILQIFKQQGKEANVLKGSAISAEKLAQGASLCVGAGADEQALLNNAQTAAKLACPVLLVVAGTQAEDTSTALRKALDVLQASSAYPVAAIVTGAKLSRADRDNLNAQFSRNGEMPVYFIPEALDENNAAEVVARYVNVQTLGARLCGEKVVMSPALFELELIEKAKSKKQRIVLAEGEEERILRATDILLHREVADIILLGNVNAIKQKAKDLNLKIDGATLIDPVSSPKFEDYASTFYELRKSKGVTIEDARKTMSDATSFGTMMVKKNDADGMVSGAINTTAHTIRPALQFIKTKPGFSVVSSVFLMCLKDRVLVFGDCAVNPNPTAQQLAEIAVTSAQTAKAFGIEPRVAMLSYSTGKSGKGPDVDLVVEATKLAKEMAPDLLLDGPLQYDAAIDPTVAKTKMPNSQVAGRATVFIFPNLNTGNNSYKAVQRAANAIAIGPVLQGLNKPVNDLSRGCLVADIVNTVAITAVQAAAEK